MTDQNTRPTPSTEELKDLIHEALQDSMDVDWSTSVGAEHVVRALTEAGFLSRPTPSSEVEELFSAITPFIRPVADFDEVRSCIQGALSRLPSPAQVEVTDERSLSAEGMLLDEDLWAEAEVALTTTDAKPVVPAEPVAWLIHKEDGARKVTLMARVAEIWVDQRAKVIPLYAAPPSPVEEEERLSADDLQTLIQVRDRRSSIIESSTDRLLQAFALSDRGLLALEQLPSGADLHITRKGRKAIDAFLASEGKTDA